jgi:hypothetical protein
MTVLEAGGDLVAVVVAQTALAFQAAQLLVVKDLLVVQEMQTIVVVEAAVLAPPEVPLPQHQLVVTVELVCHLTSVAQ